MKESKLKISVQLQNLKKFCLWTLHIIVQRFLFHYTNKKLVLTVNQNFCYLQNKFHYTNKIVEIPSFTKSKQKFG